MNHFTRLMFVQIVKQVPLGILSAGDATTSAAALAAVPSQSDAASSVSGASSLWRRSSARVGYHVKRLSGSGINGSTTLGEAEVIVTAPPAGVSSGSSPSSHPPSHPHPHPHPHPHSHSHHNHHHPEPPGQLPTVPATPQIGQSDWEPSTPSSTSSFPPAPRTLHAQAQHRTPLLVSNTDDDELPSVPPLPASGGEAEVSSSPLPAWRISPASPPGESSGNATSAVLPRHHTGEPTSMVDDNDEGQDDDDDDVVSDDHEPEPDPHEQGHRRRRLRAPAGLRFFAGRRRGRQHSTHGSGSGSGGSRSPRERSSSPHQQYQGQRQEVGAAATTVPSPHPSAPESGGGLKFPSQFASDTPAPAPSSTTSSSNSAAASGPAAGFRRAARKLSLNVPLFGLGLGLGGGGRDKDRDPHHHSHTHPSNEHHQHQQHHLGIMKKESGSSHKAAQKIRMPSSIFGSGGSGADAGAAVGVSAAVTTSARP